MDQKSRCKPEPSPSARPVVISSRQLFGKDRRVQIQHEDRVYQLTITRQNKLILTR